MVRNPKIAIIIPVFNRAELIFFTLNSIINQSFSDWECIIVDDRSTDNTFQIIQKYVVNDDRFKVYLRPISLKKGANSCRNFGFSKSSSAVIKWFDSDDIMLPFHLEKAYNVLIACDLDFVITDCVNFDHDTNLISGKPYDFDRNNITLTPDNFAKHQLGWITDDFLTKRDFVANATFNENITDGDEYNFFVRLLHKSFKYQFINEILTHRRIHNNSISLSNKKNPNEYKKIIANLKIETAIDIDFFNNKNLSYWFLKSYMNICFDIASNQNIFYINKKRLLFVNKYVGNFKSLLFILALIGARYWSKGYFLLKAATNNIKH